MRKALILAIGLFVIGSSSAQAAGSADPRIGVTLDYTFASKYMWHGFNLYGSKTASQPSVDLDFWQTGFGAMIWHSRANDSGFRNFEENDYIVYYGNSLFSDTPLAIDYNFSWLYYDYYDNPSRDVDLQELIMGFTFPNLLPGGVTASYSTGLLWPTRSSVPGLKNIGGWVHVFGLSRDVAVGEQVFSLMTDLTYNDGYAGGAVDHDWSHATFGVSTSFTLWKNFTFTPALYQQKSMDDSVNTNDDLWTTLSLAYRF